MKWDKPGEKELSLMRKHLQQTFRPWKIQTWFKDRFRFNEVNISMQKLMRFNTKQNKIMISACCDCLICNGWLLSQVFMIWVKLLPRILSSQHTNKPLLQYKQLCNLCYPLGLLPSYRSLFKSYDIELNMNAWVGILSVHVYLVCNGVKQIQVQL